MLLHLLSLAFSSWGFPGTAIPRCQRQLELVPWSYVYGQDLRDHLNLSIPLLPFSSIRLQQHHKPWLDG